MRPPRRLRIRRAGGFLILGTFGLGLASLNTGNNLLYLLVGALLGTIALSGWVSERALRGIRIQRRLPRALTAGAPALLEYDVFPGDTRLQSHGISIREAGTTDWLEAEPAWVPILDGTQPVRTRSRVTPKRRGVFALHDVTLATGFPFGLFSKERDVEVGATLVVWPRTDLPVRLPVRGGGAGRRERASATAPVAGARGEFRGLREYRAGDDPRDVHWRSSARRGELVIREFDRETGDEYWLVLETAAPDDESAEAAVATMASLVAAAVRRGDRFGVSIGAVEMPPGDVRLDSVLDLLAAVQMGSPAAPPAVHPSRCILVSAGVAADDTWAAVVRPVA